MKGQGYIQDIKFNKLPFNNYNITVCKKDRYDLAYSLWKQISHEERFLDVADSSPTHTHKHDVPSDTGYAINQGCHKVGEFYSRIRLYRDSFVGLHNVGVK